MGGYFYLKKTDAVQMLHGAIFRYAVYAVLLINQICSRIQGLMCVVNLSLRCSYISVGCSRFVVGLNLASSVSD